MIRRSRFWLIATALFTVVNLAGAVMAAAQGEGLHAGTHVALFLLGAYVIRRMVRPAVTPTHAAIMSPELDDRLTRLEQSLEDAALGVERIGEGQRFITHFFTPSGAQATSGESAAAPVESTMQQKVPVRPS